MCYHLQVQFCNPDLSLRNLIKIRNQSYSVYVRAIFEEAKEDNLGHEQSNMSDHLVGRIRMVGRNGQQLTEYHSNIT